MHNENCHCDEPGWCDRHGQTKPRGVWKLCRGVDCGPQKCAKYFAAWERGQINGQTVTPAEPLPAKFGNLVFRGLGDVISATARGLGFTKCGQCRKRQEAINKASRWWWWIFTSLWRRIIK